jgi:outer membrane biosynthesis protein TonB
MITEVQAAAPGDASEIEFAQDEPENASEPLIEVVEVEPVSRTEFDDAVADPTPKPIEQPRRVVVQRLAVRPREFPGATRGPAMAQLGNSSNGWSTPKPIYPFEARRLRRQGSGGVRVTTNGRGRVVRAEMLPGIDPLLDAVAVNFARSAWSGPPNCTRVVAITFALE